MGRFGTMPPQSKDGRLRLGEPLATELKAFRLAYGGGATEIGIVRDAVRFYIQAKTHPKRARELYERELRRLRSLKPLSIVKPDNGTQG